MTSARMRIAWAFNPFDDNRRLQKNAVALLDAVRGGDGPLEVVYVASPAEAQLATAFDVPAAERFSAHPKRLIEAALRELGVARATVTVLPQRSASLTAGVRALAAHLAQRKPALTLIASHARQGLPRLMLGSFAESFVHVSKTDLLVFNAHSRVRAPQALLFAHDLSAAADQGLRAAIGYAKRWRCALHVIHVPDPAYGFTLSGREAQVEAFRRTVREQVAGVEATLKRAGLSGSVVIDPAWNPVAELILKRRQRVRADMLVVVAKTGRLASLVGGSVTRQLLRAAPLPVLVIKT